MSRNPRQFFPDLPPAPEPYPGSERFGDWDFATMPALEPGVAPPADPRDPNKWARHGKPDLPVKKPRKR